ncbi:hypothetical protein [Candidatus Leptofilum sp.]|uniref:hypothetical protein n=1 Tax=Candidatus Leptofilum sp. TaxID=3241576 RepID=UPI003B59D98C
MMNFFPKRPLLTLTLAFFVLGALFLHRALFPAEGMALAGLDARSLFYPWWEFARTAVLAGKLPLWDANSFSGYPFLSNPQVALFYPLNWPLLLLPVRFALSWHILVHLVVAGLGMFLLVRHLSGSKAGAWLAALAFAFSGFISARIWAGHIGLIATDVWLPWLLLGTFWSVQRRTVWAAIIGGVPLALAILAGHTTSLLYIGLAWGLFAIYLLWSTPDRWLVVRQMAIMAVLGFLLAGVQLVPLAEFSTVSSRAAEPTLEFATAFSLPPSHIITWLLPEFFGEPTRSGYWSVPAFDELTYYVGLLPLLGLALALRKPSRLSWFYLVLVVLGFLLALGSYGFLYGIFYDLLPPFRLARAPGRAAFLLVFALPALLGEAVAQWERRDWDEKQAGFLRWLVGGTAVAILTSLAATGAVFAAQHPTETSGRLWHQLGGWGLALVGVVVSGWLLVRFFAEVDASKKKWWLGGLTLLLVADLWIFGFKLVQVGETAVDPFWIDAKQIIGETEQRVLPWGISIFEQNGAVQVGLGSVFGYNALEVGANIAFASSVPDPRSSAYDILGAGYVVAQNPLQGVEEGERPLQLLGNTEQVWVYQRGRTLSLARLVSQTEIIPDAAEATARVHQPDFDPATTAILEQEPDCALAGGDSEGTAVITEKSNGYWQIQTSSPMPALLVLSETAYPGWRVYVDGVEQEWFVAYTAVRATCVPAGEHIIEWRYQPRSYALGGILSLLGLALVGTAVWFLRKRGNVAWIISGS